MTDNLDALRQIEGFPIGEDEDILALSDPPNYTAYPNPHIAEFLAQHGTPYDEATDTYHREPYVGDISEGKTDPIYQAHAYHTKVPHKAISRFVLHYTEPGDVVLDGFCGTGMTGVAAQMTGRSVILNDLSPAATFIASCLNNPVNHATFTEAVHGLHKDLKEKCAWMYTTEHVDGRKGQINFTVWSDVFRCPYCEKELVLWDVAVDKRTKTVNDSFKCTDCGAALTAATSEKVRAANGVSSSVPVMIEYTVGNRRFEKRPDAMDFALLDQLSQAEIPYWYPTERMMFVGERWGDMYVPLHHTGISRVHQFYTKRNLWALSTLYDQILRVGGNDIKLRNALLLLFTSVCTGLTSKLTRYNFGRRGNGYLSGTLYVASFVAETRVDKVLMSKIRDLARIHSRRSTGPCLVTTQSSTDLSNIPGNSVDYIFVDPPFGRNLMYSELNFIWEAWLRVFTQNTPEAIVNKSQNKRLGEYRDLMYECFDEMYRVLKPNHWMTVEFSNSKASIWNAIQDSMSKAGFVVAQVAALDKKQGSYKQVTEVNAVKTDLVINAYKPRKSFEEQIIRSAGVGQERAFLRQHLDMLPTTSNVERTREMLYSKLLAYYVKHGYQIKYNADQLYLLLDREFPEADGYYFRDEAQRGEYEAKKVKLKLNEMVQAPIFILDERSALQWLWHFLDQPRSYSDIYAAYFKAPQAREDEIPELLTLLAENFVRSNGDYRRPDVATKQELEQKRQARLLREFDDYLAQARAGRKLKDVRKEAVVAGFTQAYRQQRFADILTVGRKLDKKLVEASTEIFDFMDIAEAKVER